MSAIRRVLVANRGEIARRVFRTCRSLGIDTVAVYSDADADAPFVREADIAVRIGPAAATESYLVADRILEAAARAGADAIHPGYGFLSENAEFAQACARAGVTFIGPPPAAIRAMGLKRESKALVAAAGVPVVPGSVGEEQSLEALTGAALSIGFPLLVKASAGGGGKGMRIVRSSAELAAAIEGAKREAAAAFGDDTVILERYVERPRHIEFQVLADAHGNVVHLFERECSIQRRHQKIIEESPSPAITPEQRARMGSAAVAAAAAVGYVNAGTVEFIVDPDGAFYFLEMNTRLQVEHPVTEAVTGLDLVQLQIAVAEGERLPFTQDSLRQQGAAIECRLYAEDPAAGFLPATGRLARWVRPTYDWLRVDAGVESGDDISVHYDPMIAKVITHGPDREVARRRMSRALREMSLVGITTNRAYLVRAVEHPAFVAGEVDTHFVERYATDLLAGEDDNALPFAATAAAVVGFERRRAERQLLPALRPGFRNTGAAPEWSTYESGVDVLSVGVVSRGDSRLDVWWVEGEVLIGSAAPPEPAVDVSFGSSDGESQTLTIGDVRRAATVVSVDSLTVVSWIDGEVALRRRPSFPEPGADVVEGGCRAPMPGKIIAVKVSVGDAVSVGQPLVVMEAMKMEHTVAAPADGVVEALHVAAGDQVEADAVLVVLSSE